MKLAAESRFCGAVRDGCMVCSSYGRNTAYYGDATRVRFGLAEVYSCGATTVYADCCSVSEARIGLDTGAVRCFRKRSQH